MKTKIVTRHPGAIRWLRAKGIEGEVIQHLTPEEIEEGDRIYGILPVSLILEALQRGAQVYLLVLPGIAFSQRGQELAPDEMEKAGAKIIRIREIVAEEVRE
ncbi:MAG: CRISPR-associated protein Csx16 [Methanomassiliicoccales archaeon]|nr:CRISPR-associated protein Csx16 [Methanomassiliicoccales archaeon]